MSSQGKKLYIIGIGGTGSRVLKSLSFLLASGCVLEGGFTSVVPIIIDPDDSNGDLIRTRQLLSLYQKIRANIDFEVDEKDDDKDRSQFFKQEIESLKQKNQSASNDFKETDFRFLLKDVDTKTFNEYIGFNTLSDDYSKSEDDKNFIRLLYSRSNLKSQLKVGFKGHPNMGTVVLDQITQSKTFETFTNNFNKGKGDAIFIINSIFGGTGAAGLPLILKSIKANDTLKGAGIGAITYLPYFEISDKTKDDDVDIDEIKSGSFIEKTKVALAYYNRTIIENKELDFIYFIANKSVGKHVYHHHVGSNKQKNPANFLELAGSLAIFDFCKSLQSEKLSETIVREFGITETLPKEIEFKHLSEYDRSIIWRNLSCFKVFTDYLLNKDGLKYALRLSTRWTQSGINAITRYKDSPLTGSYFDDPNYGNTIKFFIEHFREWLNEMRHYSYPSFSPFPDTDRKDALHILSNNDIVKGFRWIDRENNKLIYAKQIRKLKHKEKEHTTILFRLFEHSINNFISKNKARKQ